MVLQRLEKESDAILLRSTLCLLEVSKGGLLENELIEILAQFKEEKSSAEEQTTDYPKGQPCRRENTTTTCYHSKRLAVFQCRPMPVMSVHYM